MFEYSSELFCHSSDIGHDYREFPLGGFREATTVPSVEFSPDSTVASVWFIEGSGVSLDVWSSMGASFIGETERSLKSRFMEHRRPSSTTSEMSCHIHLDEPDYQVDI